MSKIDPQKLADAKAVVLAGLERQAQAEELVAQIETENAAGIKALCEAAGQSGPIVLPFASGPKAVSFRSVKTKPGEPERFKMAEYSPRAAV